MKKAYEYIGGKDFRRWSYFLVISSKLIFFVIRGLYIIYILYIVYSIYYNINYIIYWECLSESKNNQCLYLGSLFLKHDCKCISTEVPDCLSPQGSAMQSFWRIWAF